jgi:hypothetical protein
VDTSFLDFSTWKGMIMRIFAASVIIAAVSLGTPASGRQQVLQRLRRSRPDPLRRVWCAEPSRIEVLL